MSLKSIVEGVLSEQVVAVAALLVGLMALMLSYLQWRFPFLRLPTLEFWTERTICEVPAALESVTRIHLANKSRVTARDITITAEPADVSVDIEGQCTPLRRQDGSKCVFSIDRMHGGDVVVVTLKLNNKAVVEPPSVVAVTFDAGTAICLKGKCLSSIPLEVAIPIMLRLQAKKPVRNKRQPSNHDIESLEGTESSQLKR